MSASADPTTLRVEHLQSLMKAEQIGGYVLAPHFLVKIFTIADGDPTIKKYLSDNGFYDADKWRKLEIIQDAKFFDLLSDTKKAFLLPEKEYAEIIKIAKKENTKITRTDVLKIATSAKKFKNISKHLDATRFYEFYSEKPQGFLGMCHIIAEPEFKKVILDCQSPKEQYQQYINSPQIYVETSTGSCIDIVRLDSKKPPDTNPEGHWKLHISFDMEQCDQKKINEAYNIFLAAMQRHGIVQAKVVAPFEKINSMQGKEITIYLNYQILEPSVDPVLSLKAFILEVETLFRKHNIPASGRSETNQPILNSLYFSYRNEETRSYFIPPPIDRAHVDMKKHIEDTVPEGYKIGNTMAIYGNNVYFINNGKVLLTDKKPLRWTSDALYAADVSLLPGYYLNTAGAKRLAIILKSHPSNPFNYGDERFKLGQINIEQELTKSTSLKPRPH